MATPEKELTLEDLTRLFETQISAIQDLSALENLRVEWMGKKGHIPLQMRNLGKVAEAERKVLGQKINEVKTKVNESAVYQGVSSTEIKALQEKVNSIDTKVDKVDEKLDKLIAR